MSAKNKLVVTTPSDREILMVRDFEAPRALVWEMFTKPEHVRQWWGCKHLEVTVCEIDLRVGGEYRYVGRMPNGNLCPFKGVHHEIVYPEKIVFTEIFDVDVARDHPSLVTTTFTETNGRTTVRILCTYDSKETRDIVIGSGMEHGAAAGYDKIEEMLGALAQITVTRELAAPRSLVWKAWTEPAQFAKWYGPTGFTVPRIELDVRPGGAIRCDMRGPNTPVMTTFGTFTDVVEPERLGFTLRAEDNGVITFEMLHVVTFADRGNTTLLTLQVHVLRPTGAVARMLAGAERGWTQAFDKLGELVTR
jgi:uncharacterized protein YndB with AHSA1/START domain